MNTATPVLVHSSKIDQVARAYDIPLLDYGSHRGNGLLLAVGSGLMMTTMDYIPSLRWCVDVGGGRRGDQLESFCHWANRIVSYVAVSAWFSITSPEALRGALSVFTRVPVLIKSNIDLGFGEAFADLDALAIYANNLEGDLDHWLGGVNHAF